MENRLSDKQGEMEGLSRDTTTTNLCQENGMLLSNPKGESERRAWREKGNECNNNVISPYKWKQ